MPVKYENETLTVIANHPRGNNGKRIPFFEAQKLLREYPIE